MVFGINDAVFYFADRKIGGAGIEHCNLFPDRLPSFSGSSITGNVCTRLFCLFLFLTLSKFFRKVFLFGFHFLLRFWGFYLFFSGCCLRGRGFCLCRNTNNSSILQIHKEINDKGRKAFSADTDDGKQTCWENGKADNNNFGC